MKRIFNLMAATYKEVVSGGLTLDLLFLLEKSIEGSDISSFGEERIAGMIQTLQRKGYINEGLQPTEAGKQLYSSLLEENKSLKLKRLVKKDDEWQIFLSIYPVNNTFVWKGKKFEGDRGIRKNTEAGKVLFTKILNEGEYSVDQLCNAVIAECLQKFESSWKTSENKMKYFVNTESYLRQRGFENFIDEGKELTAEQIEAYKAAYNRKTKSTNKKSVIDI